nr:hypothetical protein [Pedobacter ginsengisoli]
MDWKGDNRRYLMASQEGIGNAFLFSIEEPPYYWIRDVAWIEVLNDIILLDQEQKLWTTITRNQ